MPDGRIARLEVPEGTTPEQVESFVFNGMNPPKPAVVSAGETIRQIPRQLGLTVRHGAEGLANVADIFAEPIAGTYNTVANLFTNPQEGYRFPTAPTTSAVKSVLDMVGVPKPENATERVVGDATRFMAGAGGIAGASGRLASAASGPVADFLTAMASNPGQQAISTAGAGLAGGSVREAGGGALEQTAAAAAGGLGAYGLTSATLRTYDAISNAIKQAMRPKMGTTEINVALTQILNKNGIDLAQVPADVRSQLSAEVKRALDTGKELNPEVVRRLADYGAVGARPTRGTATLDPVQITQERNLAKVGANSTDPRLQELARVQNENNRALISSVNDLGAATPNANPVVAGEQVKGVLRAKDAAREASVRKLYDAYKDAGGEYTNVPQTKLTEALGKVIDEMGLETLPPAVQTRLKEFGFLDSKVTRNLTIKEADLFNRLLNANNPGFGPASRSIGILKNAVSESLLDVPTKGLKTSEALLAAREAHAARMATQRSASGITAAIDDVAPDKFVQTYIINNGPKSSTREVEKLLFELKSEPAAQQAIKENIVAYFKSKALGGAADEVANFSPSAYNRALNDFGDLKLRLFFNKDEIAQLKAIGRVASYETVQPRGSAVNNSNTAGAVAGLLDRIASSPLIGKLPFGDAAIRGPAKNWAASIGAKNALETQGTAINVPQVERGSTVADLLGPALLLSAPRANSRNDDKRY